MLFSKKRVCLLAVCTGKCIPREQIPDEAFATGMLGEGVGFEPAEGTFFSPVSGTVQSIAKTGHAYTLLSDEGLEILVHIGVDTVSMKGEGFAPCVREGERIAAGERLATADLSRIREAGCPTVTAVMIAESDTVENIEYKYGSTVGARDAVMCFSVKKKG